MINREGEHIFYIYVGKHCVPLYTPMASLNIDNLAIGSYQSREFPIFVFRKISFGSRFTPIEKNLWNVNLLVITDDLCDPVKPPLVTSVFG